MLTAWSPSSVTAHPRHLAGNVCEPSSLSSSCAVVAPQLAAHSMYDADWHRYDIRYEYEYVQRLWQRAERRLQSRDRIFGRGSEEEEYEGEENDHHSTNGKR